MPTVFTFQAEPSSNAAAPSLSIHSPGGTGRPVSPGLTPPPTGGPRQPSPLSPGRSHCPVVRGLAPAAGPAGLGVPGVQNVNRSPSVNRLGSLFNSINKSVTSAFSNFVAVNQPVPGVIQDYDQPRPTAPPPPALQRQQSQPRFKAPSRRGSSQDPSAPVQALTTTTRKMSTIDDNSISPNVSCFSEVQSPRVMVSASNHGPHTTIRVEQDVIARSLPIPCVVPAARRPREGLPINNPSADPPYKANQPVEPCLHPSQPMMPHNFANCGN